MKNNIFLIGFMGTGKSTVADVLYRKYGMRVLDMDNAIEEKEGMSISEIFKIHGEEYFRNLETSLIMSLEDKDNIVVSCGGGTALRKENVDAMKKYGRVILLDATPETIFERVRHSNNRPLLEGNKNVEFIRDLLSQRIDRYKAAADEIIKVDDKNAEDVCKEIMKA